MFLRLKKRNEYRKKIARIEIQETTLRASQRVFISRGKESFHVLFFQTLHLKVAFVRDTRN